MLLSNLNINIAVIMNFGFLFNTYLQIMSTTNIGKPKDKRIFLWLVVNVEKHVYFDFLSFL